MIKRDIFLFVILILLSLLSCDLVQAYNADVAIYTGSGTWSDGIIAFEKFLDYKGITWQEISANDINNKDLKSLYKVLYMPGGYAYNYKRSINSAGVQHIRDLVNSGGGYIGICAGAYYASIVVDWEGGVYDYPLKLFNGRAYGAIDEIKPWKGYTMTTVNMELANPINVYESTSEDMLYYGGPAFYPYNGQEMNILGRWSSYRNDPAIINFNYGNGRVVLVGPHPEIEEDSDRDGTTFAQELNDKGTDWDFLWTTMDWILKRPISVPPDVPTNSAPTITSVTDSPDPSTSGASVSFTVDWNDVDTGENIKVHMCKTNTITGQTCDGGSWCDSSSFTTNDPASCSYTATTSDIGSNNYYAFVCDDSNACSSSTSGTFSVEAINDMESPLIVYVTDEPDPLNSGSLLAISANVTDNVGVNSVWVNINGVDYPMSKNNGYTGDIFFDDFESGSLSTNRWITYGVGNPWIVSTEYPYLGSYHARAKQTGAGENSYLETSINTVGYTNIQVNYYRQLVGLDAADNFAAEWWDGSKWNTLEELGSGIENDNTYLYKSFSLASSAESNPNFKIRFMCEVGAVSEQCRVDNVKLIAYSKRSGLWEYIYNTFGLVSGVYGYTVYANDVSGNNANPVSGDFVIS